MEEKSWLKQTIKLRSWRFLLGCVLAAASFAMSVLFYHKLNAGVLFAALFVLAGAVRIPGAATTKGRSPNKERLPYVYAGWLFLLAFATLFLSQLCQNEGLPTQGLLETVLGTLLILALYLMVAGITLKPRSVFFVYGVLLLFSCANHFVFQFRGSEIAPADLLSITTAGNVAAEYSYRIPSPMFYALVFGAVILFASFSLPPLTISRRKTGRICCLGAGLFCAAVVWIGGSAVTPLRWMNGGTVNNGFILNHVLLLKDSFPKKPKEYSPKAVDEVAQQYTSQQGKSGAKRDIIVIMEESYADFRVLGELNTDAAVTPFVDSLRENTLRGYTLSSIFGGGTPNSEYEFLTGNSLLYFPTGAVAYQQFIHEPTYSVAWYLRGIGYKTIAMHQYLSNGWIRDKNWPLLGFEETHFIDDFPQKEIMRGWGTDQEMFETLISVYEDHKADSDDPVFMFNVTVQNHGGYDFYKDGFQPTVHLEGYSQKYPEANEYLSCIRESDRAIQWLIDYFSRSDRDVVVLVYGDHYPRLPDEFYEELHGGKFETLDEKMLQYTVPFFIWTNYESESAEVEVTSMNFLAGLLLERAGMELPAYQQYLEDLRKTIPACNTFGYYSRSAGGFLEMDEAAGEEAEALRQYNQVVWNGVFDAENRNQIFFPAS